MTAPVISLQGVWTRYGKQVVHRDLSLEVLSGEVMGLVGGSGSGKTTLLREVLGLLPAAAGTVRLFGVDIADAAAVREHAVRRRLGMLFQQGALFSALSVYDNIAFPLRELRGVDADLIRDLVYLKLDMVEMTPAQGRLMPAELSGGMIKRVALARALALEPELLMLDEPTAGLDPDRGEKFVQLIRDLQRQLRITVLMVTHDLDTLAGLADRVAVLADQQVIACGTPRQVMAVQHPFIGNFFAGPRGQALLDREVS